MTKASNKFIRLTIITITGVNLIFSSALAQESSNITGSLGIVECVGISCLSMTAPGSLSLGTEAHFMDNAGERLLLITGPAHARLRITDSRETGSFNVSLQMTDLVNQSNPAKKISCTDNIGVMSFNESINEAVSADSIPEDPGVQSFIEPDLFDPDGQNQTYSQIFESPDSVPAEWITWFDATCNEQIITAPLGPRKNTYSMGLAFFITTPPNPEESLLDGSYQATATYTLTI